MKISTIYRIEEGILKGTEIKQFMFTILVQYPHRKSPDCYIPPMEVKGKKVKTWHCCQENCPNPDFEGNFDTLVEHIMLHKGKLLRPWNKKHQLKTQIPAVKIPPNEWIKLSGGHGTNEDRRVVVGLYIDSLKRCLGKQGIELLEPTIIYKERSADEKAD